VEQQPGVKLPSANLAMRKRSLSLGRPRVPKIGHKIGSPIYRGKLRPEALVFPGILSRIFETRPGFYFRSLVIEDERTPPRYLTDVEY
jgi:hypothetical protein